MFDNNGMDPFASFFGDFGFNFGGNEHRQEVHKGANIVIDLYASLEEMYTGNFVEVNIYSINRHDVYLICTFQNFIDNKK